MWKMVWWMPGKTNWLFEFQDLWRILDRGIQVILLIHQKTPQFLHISSHFPKKYPVQEGRALKNDPFGSF